VEGERPDGGALAWLVSCRTIGSYIHGAAALRVSLLVWVEPLMDAK